jgi:hypothetical protein
MTPRARVLAGLAAVATFGACIDVLTLGFEGSRRIEFSEPINGSLGPGEERIYHFTTDSDLVFAAFAQIEADAAGVSVDGELNGS